MLDVHPPHHPLHAWRDFFIHLATISIGLLIALSLESGVEWMHHRHEIAHTREALGRELEENSRNFATNTRYFRHDTALLENNLMVLDFLQKHPAAKPDQLPGMILWNLSNEDLGDSEWKAANQTGIVALMPQDEVKKDAELYELIALIKAANMEEFHALFQSMGNQLQKPDPTRLTPGEIGEEIRLGRQSLSIHLKKGVLMQNLAREYPSFHPAPSQEELMRLLHLPELQANPDFKAAFALTEKRLDAATPPDSTPIAAAH